MNTLEYTEHVLEVLKTAPLSIEEQAKLSIAISNLISTLEVIKVWQDSIVLSINLIFDLYKKYQNSTDIKGE